MFGWIVLGVVILIAVVSAISQMVKSQDEANPNPRRGRNGKSGDGVRTSSGDIDRFLQEIDRLRKKGAGAGAAPAAKEKPRAVAKPVRPGIPVVEPTRRRVEPEEPRPVPTARRREELPVAAVVSDEPRQPRKAPRAAAAPTIPGLGKVGGRPALPAPRTESGRQLLALLQNPQTMPVAVMLQEVLGPPKCKQR